MSRSSQAPNMSDAERLADVLRAAADVGLHLIGFGPQALLVRPSELRSLLHEVLRARALAPKPEAAQDPPQQAIRITHEIVIRLLQHDRDVAITALTAAAAVALTEFAVPVEAFIERLTGAKEFVAGAAQRAACIHCGQDVAPVTDTDALREHARTCKQSPVVHELQQMRAERDVLRQEARELEEQRDAAREELQRMKAATASRLLNVEEKRIVGDALRLLAAESRKAKSHALADTSRMFSVGQANRIDMLSHRAGTADRLAAEASEYEIRFEKVVS